MAAVAAIIPLCTMKGSYFLLLLPAAVLLGGAAPAIETVPCTQEGAAAAAQLAIRDINQNHRHGYKFRLKEMKGSNMEKVGEGCDFELQLELLETKCHVVNPKDFENCPFRGEALREVKANCTVSVTAKDGDANVTKYECETRQVKTNTEMVQICPDCVTLLPLNNTEGLKCVVEAVKKFNTNTTNKRYYILKEVGRISTGFMMTKGMNYYTEFALVETQCPMGSRIVPEACIPLCPDRAHHAFCTSSCSSTDGLESTECEFYPPLNTTELAPGEQEPMCRHHHRHHHHRPPHGHGPPPHAHNHSHGPPPHAHNHGHGPPPKDRDHEHDGSPLQDQDHGHRPPSRDQEHGHGPPSRDREHGHGPPSRDRKHGHGPPSQDQVHGHGPQSKDRDCTHGPPSKDWKPEYGHGPQIPCSHRPHFVRPCHGFLSYIDPALHPICPFREHHKQKLSQS
ncbi:alpha-2-HS-glycoprotein 1 [Betta splendens]|uniref:Alpha-2-HS-glycoprotein 1 n=1 Tax=Betta splendens TaxID=158456 RepID=A0A6P7MAY2_BETSP|nr:alpha-2-HS-glycoprotein 1 [Betta splendens]